MAVLQEYKCPCCHGAIAFDANAQKMRCPYCDSEFEMESLLAYDDVLQEEQPDQMQWQTQAGGSWQAGEADHLGVFICQSCGGQIVGDQYTGATSCPYCGNPVVMMGRFAGDLKPDLVIPFRLDKNAAIAALKRHYQGKVLLPKAFKDENHIREVKGIYVPFWLFDADANARIRYKATRVRTWSDSSYDYTETSFFAVNRGGSIGFAGVPVDGSSKMEDTLMEAIEPFDLTGAVDFQTAYLAGYLADRYDVDAQQSIQRANERIKHSTEQAFASTVMGYTSVVPEYSSISLTDSNARYALYPVWLLNTEYNGKRYSFAMNGQTGKLVGDLPMDKAAFWKWLLGVLGVVSAAAFAVSYLLWLL